MSRIGVVTAAALGGVLLTGNVLEAQREPVRSETVERRVIVAGERRGWLGITYREAESGAVAVEAVAPGSPAGRAGLRAGDSVVLWNGRRDVHAAVESSPLEPGDTVHLRVRRPGERDRDLALTAAERPRRIVRRERRGEGEEVIVIDGLQLAEGARAAAERLRVHFDSMSVHADSLHHRLRVLLRDSLGTRLEALERARLELRHGPGEALRPGQVIEGLEIGSRSVAGAELSPLVPEMAAYFDVREGVLVLKVAAETPAARAGLQAGDVIVAIAGGRVTDVPGVRRAIATGSADEVEIEIVRQGRARTIELSRN